MRLKRVPPSKQTEVLMRCARKCCLCVGLESDWDVKRGQISHLDHNPSNNAISNLVFLCLRHHDQYDSRSSQSKGISAAEVKRYRDRLHTVIKKQREAADKAMAKTSSRRRLATRKAKRPIPDFDELLQLASTLTLLSEREAEYNRLWHLALRFERPDVALRIALRFLMLLSNREAACLEIFNFLLERGHLQSAEAMLPVFVLLSNREAVRKRLLDAKRRHLENTGP
jgi:hypothetical protein